MARTVRLMNGSTLFENDYDAKLRFLANFTSENASPEEQLALAVLGAQLADAVNYCTARDPVGKQLFAQAMNYVNDESGDYIFSFEAIMAYFGKDPSYWRRKLREEIDRRQQGKELNSVQRGRVVAAKTQINQIGSLSAEELEIRKQREAERRERIRQTQLAKYAKLRAEQAMAKARETGEWTCSKCTQQFTTPQAHECLI